MNQAFSFWRLPVLFLLFIIPFQSGFAQNKVPPVWTRFNLLWVDTVWKFKPGVANPGDFDPALNDSNWRTVNEDFRDKLTQDGSTWTGIGVLRKKFYVPDSLRNKRAELIMLVQTGASEVYFDGRLVRAFGKVAQDKKNEVEFIINPMTPPETPVQLDLDSQSTHVIAVYYSYHGLQSFTERVSGARGFAIMLAPFNAASASNYEVFNHPVISLCIILGFCLFFCFVYAFYPFRLASLFSLLYMASFSLIFVSYLVRDINHDYNHFVIGDSLWRIGFTFNPGWNVLFLYSIFYSRMPKRSWIVAALMIAAMAFGVLTNAFPLMIILPLLLLMTAESWRIIILGLRKKRTGFGILAIGFFISLAGGFIAIFDVFNFFPWYLTNAQTVAAIVTDLSFPLTLALQFAREFGSANRDLRNKLVQVNELSAKNSEQEREKQQILSMQNVTLEKQVNERTNALQETITELKSTQAQLIQSEKMASLGQLTAGIAHEIQNPLNFVNNFSEVNNELIEELKGEWSIVNGEKGSGLTGELLNDIFQNNEKISHHGKRADAIVKGMLEHSRSGSGEKQLTDINALAEEYLKLSYHGMRAKDKNFNATMKTEFDKSIDKINIIPQDIGRVLLNLYNNAFYAVKPPNPLKGELGTNNNYEPIVTVSTKAVKPPLGGLGVLISVRDNGPGIPKDIIDKIFQPFFTTKPTGQGTGLGLSLAYDIIKANGGEIKVSSKEGEGTEFVILLPGKTS